MTGEPQKLLDGVRIVECSMLGPAGISTSLADLGAGLRITAIAHDETPKLLAAIALAQGH